MKKVPVSSCEGAGLMRIVPIDPQSPQAFGMERFRNTSIVWWTDDFPVSRTAGLITTDAHVPHEQCSTVVYSDNVDLWHRDQRLYRAQGWLLASLAWPTGQAVVRL